MAQSDTETKTPGRQDQMQASGSCIYTGTIRHRRFWPTTHEFEYKTRMLYIDIDQLGEVLNRFPLSHSRLPAFGWFRRSDYHGDQNTLLDQHIRDQILAQTSKKFTGKIFLLTHLRYWGLLMNPISVFYCFNDQNRISFVVLQVTNTPWREKILYVLNANQEKLNQRFEFPKQMHVSPFNPMEMNYVCQINTPDHNLVVHLENHQTHSKHTDATLTLVRQPLTFPARAGLVLGFPHQTLKVVCGIYWNALRLWLKKTPFYSHPNNTEKTLKTNIHEG